jgi:AbrB family looped-hinge helix DNA binding protein
MTKIQSRGQITLPAEIRKRVGMEPGDTVAISIYGPNEIRIRSIKPMSIEEARAKFPLDESTIGVDFKTILALAEADAADEFVENMRRNSE